MTRPERTILAILAVLLAALVGCIPVARSVPPITESHEAITATMYGDAEDHFADAGNMVPESQADADADCQRLLERRDAASAVVLGLVGLTGAGGLATIIPKDAEGAERRGWDLGLGVTTLAAATTATVLGALARSWSADYERRCVSETPAAPEPGIDADAPPVLDSNPSAETSADGGTE